MTFEFPMTTVSVDVFLLLLYGFVLLVLAVSEIVVVRFGVQMKMAVDIRATAAVGMAVPLMMMIGMILMANMMLVMILVIETR